MLSWSWSSLQGHLLFQCVCSLKNRKKKTVECEGGSGTDVGKVSPQGVGNERAIVPIELKNNNQLKVVLLFIITIHHQF